MIIQGVAASSASPISSTAEKKNTKSFDYSEYYDFLPGKDSDSTEDPGILGGLSGFLRNLQDGLSFAEFAFAPAAPVKPKTQISGPEIAFSMDDSVGFSQMRQKKDGFIPASQPRQIPPQKIPQQTGGALQSIFENLGLCNRR